MEYAEWYFPLVKPDQDGVLLKDRLIQLEGQTNKTPKELEGPDFPIILQHVWSAFFDLSRDRTIGFNGPERLTSRNFLDWMKLNHTLLPRDIEAIKRLDDTYMKVLKDG